MQKNSPEFRPSTIYVALCCGGIIFLVGVYLTVTGQVADGRGLPFGFRGGKPGILTGPLIMLLGLGFIGYIVWVLGKLSKKNKDQSHLVVDYKKVMDILSKIEKERNIIFPEIYKTFYKSYAFYIPVKLVGTDLFNDKSDMNDDAAELLDENGVENFLAADDFVFMMHQGYIFWYFKADGNPDPPVFSYHESKGKPESIGTLSNFVKEYI